MSKDFEGLVQDFYEAASGAVYKEGPPPPGPDSTPQDWAEYMERESRKKSLLRHVAEKQAKRDIGKEQKDQEKDFNKSTFGKKQGVEPQIQKQSRHTRTDVIESRKKEGLQRYDEKRFRDPSSSIERSRLEGASDREHSSLLDEEQAKQRILLEGLSGSERKLSPRLVEEPIEQLDERLIEQFR